MDTSVRHRRWKLTTPVRLAALAAAVALSFVASPGGGTQASPSHPPGGYLDFPGPGSGYVEVPDDPALNPADAITIEVWVYLRQYGGLEGGSEPSLVGKNYHDGYWLGLSTEFSDYGEGRIRFYPHGSASWLDGPTQIPLDAWTHIAVTYDGTTQRHYINGMLAFESSDKPGPLTATSDPLRIGSDVSWDYSPDGSIDEVRLWNVARSQAEIQATMNSRLAEPAPGLVAAWHFGGNALDAAGGHDGTLIGDAEFAGSPIASGDVDCNESENSVDALFILRFNAHLEPYADCIAAGDVNCDENTNSLDALMVLRHVAHLDVDLPPGCPPVGFVG